MRKNILISGLIILLLLTGAGLALSDNKRKNSEELYRQVELFSDTLAIVQKEYVDEKNPKELIYGALKGMLAALDPHSQFMDPEAYEELKVDTQGKFGGLGIEITIKDGLLTVITPIEDTPAWKAGIKAQDRIVKIDDVLTREMSLADAVKKMRGDPGQTVHLTVLRDTEKKLLDFNITRAMIKIKDIKNVGILEDGVGYIRLTEFRENTFTEFNSALSKLAQQKMEALIVDLRNNPGGLLEVAVKVTGKFVPFHKLIVYTKGNGKDKNLEFFSDTRNPILDLPLVILINAGSASGSEIVAGALQDYKRAMIIGIKSFGKGSVQTIIPLNEGCALRLTTSHYFTPSGKIIHGQGVTPDIVVEEPKESLSSDDKESKPKAAKEIFKEIENQAKNLKLSADSFDYKTDPQIMRAVEALKVVRLYKQNK